MMKLENIYRMTQRQLKKYVAKEMKKANYADIQNKDGYIYAKGAVPVLLVAHLDTVHEKPVRDIVYSNKGNHLSSPQGLGGDDRNGVYMILEIIKEIKCHVLFVEDEEMGLVGANIFCRSFKGDMDINYIIELDRRGFHDAVYYSLDNKEFEKFITESSGGHFKTELGTCSDISEIAPFLGVAAVNLSAGYYKEHRPETYTVISEVNENIEHVKEIINTKVDNPFEYKEIRLWKDDSLYSWNDDGFDEYAVEFWDTDGVLAVNIVEAFSKYEAIGLTVSAMPSLRGFDIVWSGISTEAEMYEVNRFYLDGELTQYV